MVQSEAVDTEFGTAVVNMIICDQCDFKVTLDIAGTWIVLSTVVTPEDTRPGHFCSIECVKKYVKALLEQRMEEAA